MSSRSLAAAVMSASASSSSRPVTTTAMPILSFLYPVANQTLASRASSIKCRSHLPRGRAFSASRLQSSPTATTKAQSLSYQPSTSAQSTPPMSVSSSPATASVDPACATLSPSSPAAKRSQKDPRVLASTDNPVNGEIPSTSMSPSEVADIAKKPAVAATMPEATSATSSASPSSSPPTARKTSDRGTKFRARAAALKLTPTAVLRLRALLESDAGPKLIRVGVRNKGCAGMSYHLEYIKPEEAARFDERVQQDGVQVLIDSKALFSIIGSEMDWQEDRLSAKFVFNNPNVKEACGCGESFLT